jgi:tyrosyl-tRNA synthetase
MKLSEELVWRGFANQTTYKDISALDGEPITFYWGVDPSSDSMTIGNLAAGMMIRCFMEHGHRAVLLVGGATGLIGDPDGKSDERNLKTTEEIAKNKSGIEAQYKQIFAGKDFTLVDNYDWFKDMKYLDFLRDVGKYVPMGQMISREFVQSRIGSDGSGISYAEFSYALMQGYDFVYLSRNHGVTLQLCGSDQWGNSITGVDLIRRMDGREVHVYSTPLVLNKSTGQKFGKSEGGAIWLDADRTSVYKFYQFWLNVDDEGACDYLKMYTRLNKDEIDKITEDAAKNPSDRLAQKTLAHEVTKLVHGADRTASVESVTEVLFGGKSFDTLGDQDIEVLADEIPAVTIGKTLVESLVETGIADSNGEARRLIANGAVSVNFEKVVDDQKMTSKALIKKGKNSFILVR